MSGCSEKKPALNYAMEEVSRLVLSSHSEKRASESFDD
jgi:hypothetical protein